MTSVECWPSTTMSGDANDAAWAPLIRSIAEVYSASADVGVPLQLKHVFVAQFLLSTASLALVLATALKLLLAGEPKSGRQRLLFTANTRILILGLLVALLTANIGVLLSSVYHLQVLVVRERSTWCYWLSFTFSDCQFIKSLSNVALFVVYSSSTAIAVDRCVGAICLDAKVSRKLRIALSALLVVAQWVGSVALTVRYLGADATTAERPFAHCAAHVPLPTQRYAGYYAILTWQVVALSAYTMLTYHHSTPLVHNELRHALAGRNVRKASAIYESIVGVEHSLPVVALIVSLFVLNMALDRNFVLTLAALLARRSLGDDDGDDDGSGGGGPRAPLRDDLRDLTAAARWTECQVLLTPLLSFAVFGVIRAQLRAFSRWDQEAHLINGDFDDFVIETLDAAVYERVGSEAGDLTTASTSSSATASVASSSGSAARHSCRLDSASAVAAAVKVEELRRVGKLPPPAPPLSSPPPLGGRSAAKAEESSTVQDDKNERESGADAAADAGSAATCTEKLEEEDEDNYQDAVDV